MVSVVVPCHDYARYLPDALASIFAQTGGALEVIVVDDGSTDASAQVAADFDPRVRVIRQPQQGISGARNAGIAAATGDMIAFLDADDIWPPDSLSSRLAVFEADPGTDCVFGQLSQFVCPRADAETRARLACPPGAIAARFPGTMLARRRVFDKVGMFDTSLRLGEMIEWASRLAPAGIVVMAMNTCVLERRIHGANTVLNTAEGRGNYLRALHAGLRRRRAS